MGRNVGTMASNDYKELCDFSQWAIDAKHVINRSVAF